MLNTGELNGDVKCADPVLVLQSLFDLIIYEYAFSPKPEQIHMPVHRPIPNIAYRRRILRILQGILRLIEESVLLVNDATEYMQALSLQIMSRHYYNIIN